MLTLNMSREQYTEIITLDPYDREEWDAVFSCNQYGDIWPPPGDGYTYPGDRAELVNPPRRLQLIANSYLRLPERPIGGRIFINEKGAYWKDRKQRLYQFVCFTIEEARKCGDRSAVSDTARF